MIIHIRNLLPSKLILRELTLARCVLLCRRYQLASTTKLLPKHRTSTTMSHAIQPPSFLEDLCELFHRCGPGPIYHFEHEIPMFCPRCGEELREVLIEWKRLKSPFVSQFTALRTILLKPTNGMFKDYNVDSLLHVGISNSKGVVYNFDERGLSVDHNGWEECIGIQLHVPLDDRDWDRCLIEHSQFFDDNYEPLQHNCYDYVISFLHFIRFSHHGRTTWDKDTFSDVFVEKPLNYATKWVMLCRYVRETGHFFSH
eukprot:Colp12_sorted_trinity150504_noHs@13473